MSSPLMESLGLGGLDIAYLFIAIFILLIIVIILMAIQLDKYAKLKKKYNRFMKGKDGKSLEKDIIALFEENKIIKGDNEQNKGDIREIQRRLGYCYQKMGLVKYDAFQQMGGKLSFCLVLLNDKNDGFLLNSVHSSEGCYSYTKEIVKGESSLSLGEEEKKALEMAIGY